MNCSKPYTVASMFKGNERRLNAEVAAERARYPLLTLRAARLRVACYEFNRRIMAAGAARRSQEGQ